MSQAGPLLALALTAADPSLPETLDEQMGMEALQTEDSICREIARIFGRQLDDATCKWLSLLSERANEESATHTTESIWEELEAVFADIVYRLREATADTELRPPTEVGLVDILTGRIAVARTTLGSYRALTTLIQTAPVPSENKHELLRKAAQAKFAWLIEREGTRMPPDHFDRFFTGSNAINPHYAFLGYGRDYQTPHYHQESAGQKIARKDSARRIRSGNGTAQWHDYVRTYGSEEAERRFSGKKSAAQAENQKRHKINNNALQNKSMRSAWKRKRRKEYQHNEKWDVNAAMRTIDWEDGQEGDCVTRKFYYSRKGETTCDDPRRRMRHKEELRGHYAKHKNKQGRRRNARAAAMEKRMADHMPEWSAADMADETEAVQTEWRMG